MRSFPAFLVFLAALPLHAADPNTLSEAEVAEGWQLLFDGKSTAHWRALGKADFPRTGWGITNGCLVKLARISGGHIITREKFTDFDFQWEWRIATNGNNGVKYFITEKPNYPGHEYQLIDDNRTRDQKSSTGSFYTILAPTKDKPLNSPGQWNQSRIRVQGDHVEHWLNGKKVVEYDCSSDQVRHAAAQSKYRNVANYGVKIPNSHILLTDHRDETWFRNLKIRRL
jgi:3-keto-disaccharide hydrolase